MSKNLVSRVTHFQIGMCRPERAELKEIIEAVRKEERLAIGEVLDVLLYSDDLKALAEAIQALGLGERPDKGVPE